MAGQHSAKWKPLLRGQPHHRAVGPHRSTLLLQVSRLRPHAPPPHPTPASPAFLSTGAQTLYMVTHKARLQHRGQRQAWRGAGARAENLPAGEAVQH